MATPADFTGDFMDKPWLLHIPPGENPHRDAPDVDRGMSVASVRAFLAEHAPDLAIVELPDSTATVAQAAAGHGVAPAQIAKTLSLSIAGRPILLVTSGDTRLDNKKAKAAFGGKPRMLGAEEVLALTGHPVGGGMPIRPGGAAAGVLRRVTAGVRRSGSGGGIPLRCRPDRSHPDGGDHGRGVGRCLRGQRRIGGNRGMGCALRWDGSESPPSSACWF